MFYVITTVLQEAKEEDIKEGEYPLPVTWNELRNFPAGSGYLGCFHETKEGLVEMIEEYNKRVDYSWRYLDLL